MTVRFMISVGKSTGTAILCKEEMREVIIREKNEEGNGKIPVSGVSHVIFNEIFF